MMETIIAIGCGVVVGGGLLTLVYRILAGDREAKQIDQALDALVAEAATSDAKPTKKKAAR